MKNRKKWMPLILIAMCMAMVFSVIHFAPMPHQFWGTYSTGNEPLTDSLYLVLQTDGRYTIYRQFEVLEKGTFEPLLPEMGNEDIVYRLTSQDTLSETKLVYDKESDAVVLLDYQDEDIPMGRISRDALFVNVDSGSSEGHPAAHETL
ncbi:MAG: hypothetical protein HFH21_12030 [Ruminococcus sp.]|jgi:hypothetical protein|nr:hypothetical protein [uncultured Schaedlerella sp.]MCI8768489.1 hypothetical protein [Ruminococcus sp.]